MTMDKALTQTRDKVGMPEDKTPKAQTPAPGAKEPSPKQDRTYSQQEVDRVINLTKMESGRERKAAELERDNYKSQVQAKDTQLQTVQDELSGLEKRIEELSSKDPELNNLEKRAKQLREQERKIKTDTATLEAENQKHSQTLTELREVEQAVTVWQIAEMYSGGNEDRQAEIADRLIDLTKSLDATTEDKIHAIAETLYGQVGDGEVSPPSPRPFTGGTSGGGMDTDTLSPREKIEYGLKNPKKT